LLSWAQLLVLDVALLVGTAIFAVREWRKPAGQPGAFVSTILLALALIIGPSVNALGLTANVRISIAAMIVSTVLSGSGAVMAVVVAWRRNHNT
jgi:hypothetical protein